MDKTELNILFEEFKQTQLIPIVSREFGKFVKSKKNTIIPLNVFQTWHSLELPTEMTHNRELLKSQNPEFTYYLYDDAMCRTFIAEHFDNNVVYAFDKLKPGAYKADLWRYCVLYVKGGIYLDIKLGCVNNFRLMQLTKEEHYVRDRLYDGITGIYQALLSCMPNNKILYGCINQIVENVKNDEYGKTSLQLTGPHLMANYFDEIEISGLELCFLGDGIYSGDMKIIVPYDKYREEQYLFQNEIHYSELWVSKNIYNYPSLTYLSINGCDSDNNNKLDKSFVVYNGELCAIDEWYPLQIKYNNMIQIKYNMPLYFKNVYGTSQGYEYDGYVWFVLQKTHNNHYFFAQFDTNMDIIKYSELFKLDAEYCNKIIINDKYIILYYNSSIKATYDIEYVSKHLKWH